jgi:hypothetical protein
VIISAKIYQNKTGLKSENLEAVDVVRVRLEVLVVPAPVL